MRSILVYSLNNSVRAIRRGLQAVKPAAADAGRLLPGRSAALDCQGRAG